MGTSNNLVLSLAIHTALENHHHQGRGINMAYPLDAELIGNRRSLKLESLVTDLKYADDMVLLANSWSHLKVMLESPSTCCISSWVSPSAAKTKSLAVIPPENPDPQRPEPICLDLGDVPILKWSPASSTWVAPFRMTMGQTQR